HRRGGGVRRLLLPAAGHRGRGRPAHAGSGGAPGGGRASGTASPVGRARRGPRGGRPASRLLARPALVPAVRRLLSALTPPYTPGLGRRRVMGKRALFACAVLTLAHAAAGGAYAERTREPSARTALSADQRRAIGPLGPGQRLLRGEALDPAARQVQRPVGV